VKIGYISDKCGTLLQNEVNSLPIFVIPADTTESTFEGIYIQEVATLQNSGDSQLLKADFQNLFIICASLLGFVLILNILGLVIYMRKKYEKNMMKTTQQNYEDLRNLPRNVYSSLNTDETNPCLEGSAIGKIRLLNHRHDNKYTLEIKTRPFQLTPANCGVDETVVASNSTPSPVPDRQREAEENPQSSEYLSLDFYFTT
jgi:hypothetical protein